MHASNDVDGPDSRQRTPSPVALRTTHFSLPIGETGMSWPESRGAAGMHGWYSVLFKTSFAAQQALGRLTV